MERFACGCMNKILGCSQGVYRVEGVVMEIDACCADEARRRFCLSTGVKEQEVFVTKRSVLKK